MSVKPRVSILMNCISSLKCATWHTLNRKTENLELDHDVFMILAVNNSPIKNCGQPKIMFMLTSGESVFLCRLGVIFLFILCSCFSFLLFKKCCYHTVPLLDYITSWILLFAFSIVFHLLFSTLFRTLDLFLAQNFGWKPLA